MAYVKTQVETLTDGSKVWNVLVKSDQDTRVLEFHCPTEKDASAFETKLYLAIQDHTNGGIFREV